MKSKFTLATHHIFKVMITVMTVMAHIISYGQQSDLVLNEDLSLRFITVDDDGSVRSATSYATLQTIGFFMLSKDDFDVIRLCNDDPFDIWINGRLFYPEERCKDLSWLELNSLSQSDSIYIVLNTNGDFSAATAHSFKNNFDRTIIYYPLSDRGTDLESDIIITVVLLVVVLLGSIKYYTPSIHRALFELTIRPGGFPDKSMEMDQRIIVTTLLLSFVSAICFWYIHDFSMLSGINSYFQEIFQILFYTLVAFIALIMKYLFIGMVAHLNSLRHLPYIQFYDFIKFFTLVSILLLVIFGAKYWMEFLDPAANHWVWRNFYLLAYGTFLLYYFIKLGLGFKYKKLHIISYLCTTEILGVLLVALIFTK